jgi:hypothetical protein
MGPDRYRSFAGSIVENPKSFVVTSAHGQALGDYTLRTSPALGRQ